MLETDFGDRPFIRSPGAHHRFAASASVQVLETAMLIGAGPLAGALGGTGPGDAWRLLACAAGVLALGFHLAGAYRFEGLAYPRRALGSLAQGGLLGALLLLVVGLVAAPGEAELKVLAVWVGLAAGGGALVRAAASAVLSHRLRTRPNELADRVALYGWGKGTATLARRLGSDPAVRLVGVYDERREPREGAAADLPTGLPTGGSGQDLVAAVRRGEVDRVVIGLPWHAEARLGTLMRLFATTPIHVDLCPEPILLRLAAPRFDRLGSTPLVTAIAPPIQGWHLVLKRLEDIVVAGTGLALLFLPLLVVWLLIRLETPGPAIFRQPRTGFNNQSFTLFKFRTMFHGPLPDPGERQATRHDPRVTRLGRILRRTSIDELPQLWNVLRGEMSVVGPRPLSLPHNRKYSMQLFDYFGRHNVKPGITGWAQVNGLRGEITSDDVLRRWVEHDLHYVNNFSILFDVKIIALTLLRFWRQPTAY